MDAIFMYSENSTLQTEPYRLLLSLENKISLKRCEGYVPLSNLIMYYTWKIYKSYTKTINLKCQVQHGINNLNYLMDHVLFQIFMAILNIS